MAVTLRDVAAAAGVSSATASRALDPSGVASPATRERVQRAAESLGYRANVLARSLRTRRTHTLGLLVPDVRNPFFTDLAYVIDKAAAGLGYTVMMGNADEDAPAQDRYLQTLLTHRVDGILVVPQGAASPVLAETVRQLPTVCIDRDPGLEVPVVASDNETGMAALVDHVVALGHRDVALVAGPQTTSTGRERAQAAAARLAHHGVPLRPGRVVSGDYRLASGIEAATRLLDAAPRPEAIIAADSLMALGVLLVARARGVRIGVDVGLAAFDDSPWFPLLDPPVTVVAHDTEALGRVALELLTASIDGRATRSRRIPTTLIARRSLGEPATATPVASDEGGPLS